MLEINMIGIEKKAFTLAELLIVLGIIGIVAALTMPTLIANHREKETVTKLKKVYSTLSNAYNLAIAENGTPDNWDLIANGSPEGAENGMNMIAQYLNVSKNCGINTGCFPDLMYKNLNGNNSANFDSYTSRSKMILSDGTLIAFVVQSADCTYNWGSSLELQQACGWFYVDVNGFKPPNTIGKDFFLFNVTKNTITPTGTQDETRYTFNNRCNTQDSSESWGCTAWVLLNENQDYLKCNDLSWDGKTKCK